ncbi:MAG TPA: hypothetical protein VH300_17660 [Thermoleophilaceae bacterium]|jgi:hypothetical protein|nr:hypothetical protein [Thermoleophilaceae bacterium]
MATTAERDYSHRSTVQKLAVKPDQRLEVSGEIGSTLRRELREELGRGFIKSGQLDGAIALVESIEEAKELIGRYRPRLRDTGYIWLVTWKRGHDAYVDQMKLVPCGKELGLIDNKTCSIDSQRSGIRFVVPRALRGKPQD